MKLAASILLSLALSADAFVIQTTKPSSSTTSLNDIALQWGFDGRGSRTEYYLEHWSERNNDCPQSQWAYDDPWSGVSQTLFEPRHINKQVLGEMQRGFASKDILGTKDSRMGAPAAPAPEVQQQVAPLPPSEPAQPMPEGQVPADAAAPQYAAQNMMN